MAKTKTKTAKLPLMGVKEVCDELGVATGNLDRLRGLPEPVDRVTATRLWEEAEIKKFAARLKRRRQQQKG